MQLTKQQKIMMGVLGLGLGALVIDRVVLGPPEEAAASQPVSEAALPVPDAATQAPESAGIDADESAGALPSYTSLTERLAHVMERSPTGEQGNADPFALPDGWSATTASLAVNPDAVPDSADASVQQFLERYTLDGTHRTDNVQLAVIKDKDQPQAGVLFVEKGHALGPFTLQLVANRAVLWEWETPQGVKQRFVMKMPRPEPRP